MALGTVRPGTEIIFGANEKYSSSYSPLKFFVHHGRTLHFPK